MVRGSLVSIIYSKTLRLGAGAATKSEATTLMSADVERIVVGLRSLHELWGCALDLGIALWLLYRQVGLAMLSLAGMALGIYRHTIYLALQLLTHWQCVPLELQRRHNTLLRGKSGGWS